jgi:hypothetical protein
LFSFCAFSCQDVTRAYVAHAFASHVASRLFADYSLT